MLTDLRQAGRDLVRQPGFTLLATLTLAVGIGASAAIFSVVDYVVLRPMPYPNGDRMAYVSLESPPEAGQFILTPSLSLARVLAGHDALFDGVELYHGESRVTQGPDGAEEVQVLHAQPSLFRFLGGSSRVGRTFGDADAQPDAPNVAVISSDLWRQRYGGDASVLEQDIRLDDQLYRIVGVMQPGFRVPRGNHQVWLPLRPDSRQPDTSRRVSVLAVLKPDVTVDAATAEVRRLAEGRQDADALVGRGFRPRVVPPAEFTSGTLRRSSLVLFGAVGLLLLIACVNVAALLVTRNAARTRDVAIRRALGATRARLVRSQLAEALLLGTAAGLTGLLIAMWILDAAQHVVPERLLTASALAINPSVLAFTAGLSLLTTMVFGLLPALQGTRVDLTGAMRSDPRSGGTTPGRHRTRRLLTAAEVALAVVLLVGAGLLVRSFGELQRTPLGFDPTGIMTAEVNLPAARYADEAARRAFFDRLLAGAEALPGATGAALATGLPPSMGLLFGEMRVDDEPEASGRAPSPVSFAQVSDAYFAVLGVRLLEGRPFGPEDTTSSERVVIVNEGFARRAWPGQSALGKRLTLTPGPKAIWMTVVGVAANVSASSVRPIQSENHGDYQLYQSLRQTGARAAAVVVRTAAHPSGIAPDLRAVIAGLDPMLPIREMATGEDRIAEQLAGDRFNLVLLGTFASVGLLLAAIGIYGMMAMYVAHRRHEIGVRLALGATPHAVARLIVRQGLTIAAAGLVVGLFAAIWLTRFMQTLLHGVERTDPQTLGGVVVVIGAIAVVATVVPVRRALGVSPADALRTN